jgi:hypothetical protein
MPLILKKLWIFLMMVILNGNFLDKNCLIHSYAPKSLRAQTKESKQISFPLEKTQDNI